MSRDSAQVLSLTQDALDNIDDPTVSLSAVLRKAIRVARMRNDYEDLARLGLEMDFRSTGVDTVPLEYSPHFSKNEWKELVLQIVDAYIVERSLGSKKDNVFSGSVDDLEYRIQLLASERDTAKAPDGLTPIDLYMRDRDYAKVRGELSVTLIDLNAILQRIRQRVFSYLSKVEAQLLLGQYNSDIFERNRSYVDAELAKVCPSALEMFSSAYRRMNEEGAEARSQALTSCRRILKEIADNFYPSPSEKIVGMDGKLRKLNDSQFVARLWQFSFEKLRGSASGDLLKAAVESIGNRVDALNALSSKGVHDKVTQEEAEQCIIQTYLVAGDLLRLAQGDSGLQQAALESTKGLTE
ncbi:hypothetical protein ACFOY4_20800 [Actinomadura syzygii]|uniref:AbiTii domain-containing protein n=1 Tax=Actinomadura syzygii TaxID=1427538 RepID=A0A5D0TPQ6_9ACTN|nr:hypothetical protein [Actinomadura syzygii]TYC07306.1 hypothetical protein FXF65_43320 [Actinomadura syzygii]